MYIEKKKSNKKEIKAFFMNNPSHVMSSMGSYQFIVVMSSK